MAPRRPHRILRHSLSGQFCAALLMVGALLAPYSGTLASDSPGIETLGDELKVVEGLARQLDGLPVSDPPVNLPINPRDNRVDNFVPPDSAPDVELRTGYGSSAYVSAVSTQLFGDADHDGYYRGFSLSVDVDTRHPALDVYFSIYLQRPGFPLTRLHTTYNFQIHGNSNHDEYRVEIELLDNYRARHYDVVLEIHDAYDGTRLDSVGAHEFRNLNNLPLESADGYPANDDIAVVEYAGSADLWTLAALSLGGLLMGSLRRRRAQPQDPAVRPIALARSRATGT